MLFTTGYQANLGVISSICGRGDTVLMDRDAHASIYDGARLSGAQVLRFHHNDVDHLDRMLRGLGDKAADTLVVVESIYSMLGDRAPLTGIVGCCRRHGALLMVDEAHGLGLFGERGLGVAEADGVIDSVDFLVGTFSKSLGTIGGYCVSRHPVLELMRLRSRPYLFTASAPHRWSRGPWRH